MTKTTQVPPLFKDRVTLRIKEAKREASKSSGKNMEAWICEIIKPTEVQLDEKLYDLTGHEIRYYLMLEGDNLEQTEGVFSRLEFGPVDTGNTDAKSREGVCFEAIISSTENIEQKPVKNPTTGKIEWKPILDRNNKPISTGWEFKPQNLKQVLCRDTETQQTAPTNRPY